MPAIVIASGTWNAVNHQRMPGNHLNTRTVSGRCDCAHRRVGAHGSVAQNNGQSGDKNSDGALRTVGNKEHSMSVNTKEIPNFFSRVIKNDSARKGIAAAAAGIIIAAVSEALWPNS